MMTSLALPDRRDLRAVAFVSFQHGLDDARGRSRTGLVAESDFTTLHNKRKLAVDRVGVFPGLLGHFAD